MALENKLGEFGSALAARTGIEWFNGLGESVGMVTGLIFIVCVLLFRRGIVGELQALMERGRRGKRGRDGEGARMGRTTEETA